MDLVKAAEAVRRRRQQKDDGEGLGHELKIGHASRRRPPGESQVISGAPDGAGHRQIANKEYQAEFLAVAAVHGRFPGSAVEWKLGRPLVASFAAAVNVP